MSSDFFIQQSLLDILKGASLKRAKPLSLYNVRYHQLSFVNVLNQLTNYYLVLFRLTSRRERIKPKQVVKYIISKIEY